MTNQRYSATIGTVTVATSAANSTEIEYSGFADGMVYIPTGSALTTLTWHTSATKGGTYLAAEDAASAAVTQTVAQTQAHPIPTALRGARFLKITGNDAGTVAITLKD
jgi:hypothetical protein